MELIESKASLTCIIDSDCRIKQSFVSHIAEETLLSDYYAISTDVIQKMKEVKFTPFKFLTNATKDESQAIWISIQPIESKNYGTQYFVFQAKETRDLIDKDEVSKGHELDFLKNVFDTAVDGIFVIDKKGTIILVNQSASEQFGYSKEELWGKNIRILMPNPESQQHDSYISNYLRTGEAKIIGIGREVTGLRKNSSKFPFRLSISELFIEGQIYFTGFVHDISDLKETEEKLRRSEAELKRSNAELMDFAYVSSHDLQEPLRKIQAFGDRLKTKEYEKLSEQGRDYVDRMLNASTRMQKLIQDLLAYSRVSTKGRQFELVNLQTILEDVLQDLEITLEQKQAKITYNTLPTIEADAMQMRQLFQNIISNALKFTQKGKPAVIDINFKLVQLRAHLQGNAGDEFIEIYFKDNGIGFEEKYLDRIFNVFQKLEGQKYEGSGIGLAICKKIVTRHGGDITAKSIVGSGSTFIVKLSTKQTSYNLKE